jgi:hypothetical protein
MQPQRLPNPFAAFALVAARAGLGALGGGVGTTQSKGKKSKGGGCTPCAAQARKDAAQAFVRGMRGGGE